MPDLIASFFVKGRISDHDFLADLFLLSHLLAKANSLPLNSSMLKDKTRVLRWRDLTGPDIYCPPHPDKVQVPHLLERTTVKCPSVDVGGGGGVVVEASV